MRAYLELMDHLGLTPRTIGVGESEQNGDVEANNGASFGGSLSFMVNLPVFSFFAQVASTWPLGSRSVKVSRAAFDKVALMVSCVRPVVLTARCDREAAAFCALRCDVGGW